MRSIIFMLISIPIALQAQWNYDNQNIVYSLNGKVGIGTQDPIGTPDVSGIISLLPV